MKKDFLNKRPVLIFLLLFLIYAYFLNPSGTNMSNVVLDAAISFVEKGNFEVSNKGFYDVAQHNGKYYSGFPPGPTILAIPLYAITKPIFKFISPFFANFPTAEIIPVPQNILTLHFFCTIFIIIPLSALLVVLFYKILDDFSQNKKYKLLTTFVLGFGTLLFYYSTAYYAATIGLFCLFFSFYLLFKIKIKKIKSILLILSGFSAGAVILINYLQIPVIILLFFYLLTFIRDKRVFFFLIGVAAPIICILFYQWLIFGNPFTTSYHFRPNLEFLGLSHGFLGLTYPHLKTLYLLTFSLYRGIFIYSPILLLAFYGLILKIRGKWASEMWLILSIFLVSFFINAAMQEEIQWAGTFMAFGPRHLLTVVPFLMLPLIFIFEKIKHWVFDFGAVFLIFLSIFINYLGVSYGLLSSIGAIEMSASDRYNPLPHFFSNLIHYGPRNTIIEIYFPQHFLVINIAGLLILGLILFIIYKKLLKC